MISITKDEINLFPLKSFGGSIHVAEDAEQSESFAKRLKHEKCLGFDTETRPSFKKGQVNQIALIQIATLEEAYLFRISKTGLTEGLRRIIENQGVLKIGLDPCFELRKLHESHDVRPAGFIDLANVAKKYECNAMSLRGLAAVFLKIRISKSCQTSNWEKNELEHKQLLYAATDAWACLAIYEEMKRLSMIDGTENFVVWNRKNEKQKMCGSFKRGA